MQNLEEQLKKAVSELTEKVKQHKGEIIFCLRNFNVTGEVTGDFVPPMPTESNYYETGIIFGEMQKNEKPEMKRIDLPDFRLRRGGEDRAHDYIFGSYSVPVDRKLNGFIDSFGNSFQFDIKDLEGLRQEQLFIDPRDFEDFYLFPSSLFPGQKSRKTDILIGDEKAERFLKEKRIKNYQELLDILKNPLAVEGRINEHYSQEAKKLGEEIVVTANEIANAFRKVKGLENNVLHSHYIPGASSDERDWDKEEEIESYHGLKRIISSNLSVLKGQLSKGENPKLFKSENFQFLYGEVIGFPARVLVDDYLNYAKKTLIPDIEGTFAKIDSYLSEQRKKISR